MTIIKSTFMRKKPISGRFSNAGFDGLFLLAIALAVMLTATSHSVAAQKAPSLTLSEAIQRTFTNHPELQIFQHKINAHQGRAIQSGLSPKPEVELRVEDALGSGQRSGFDSAQTTLSVAWVLDQSIKEKRTAVTNREISLIEREREIKQLDTAAQTARYFLKTLALQESSIIVNRGIFLAKTTVKETKKRVKVGKTPIAELYLAEAELAKRKLVLVDLKHELESSIRQLAAQWGSTSPTFNSVSEIGRAHV